MVKNLPAMWETWGLIPGLRKSPGEGNSLAWRIPRTVEPDWLQSMELQRVGHD